MLQLVISISNNLLKCTYINKKGEFQSHSVSIPNNLVDDSYIIDAQNFSEFLKTTLNDFLHKKYSKCTLTFLIEPQDTFSTIIQTPNSSNELSNYDYLIENTKHALESVDINELYYSFDKIAPFLRHFIGVKKSLIDNLMQVSLNLNMPLKSVLPWVSLLPKYSNALDPSLFIVHNSKSTTFLLSEYNNTYISKKYNNHLTTTQIESHIHEITKHEKTSNIKKVYYLGKENFDLKDNLEFIKITIPNSSVDNAKGFELHLLTHFMLDFDKDLLLSSVNSLNLLPIPVVAKKNSIVTYAPAVVTILLLLVGIYFAGSNLNNTDNSTLALNDSSQDIAGLSTSNDTENISEEVIENETLQTQESETAELNKSDIKINIQNGAGIVGLAGRTKIFLQNLGYGIYDIGDANVFGLEQTRIRFKKSNVTYKDLLKSDLENRFLDIVIEEDLDEEIEYDVLLILGSNVNEEE